MTIKKKAIVVHSGGMDSSLCLALAVQEFGAQNVLSLSFDYGQRHQVELLEAHKISQYFQVDHTTLKLECLNEITENALTRDVKIEHKENESPNTLVAGRNGLFARLAAIHAYGLGAKYIYLGVMELESANSGYRDCSREYMDLVQSALRMDFNWPDFEIRTPLIHMDKLESMRLGFNLKVLEFLLEETVTCYEGIKYEGCGKCPACNLRNSGLKAYLKENSELHFSWKHKI
jgi:7-cyano-7-deazaguanine synthase